MLLKEKKGIEIKIQPEVIFAYNVWTQHIYSYLCNAV